MSDESPRPFGWKYLRFAELLNQEIESTRTETTLGVESVEMGAGEFLSWLQQQMPELQAIWDRTKGMIRDVLPLALGPATSAGDDSEIAYVASQLGETYRAAVSWPLRFRSVRTDARWSGVIRETSLLASNIVSEFQRFAAQMATEVPEILRRAQAGQPVGPGFALNLSMPDMQNFNRELEEAKVAFGIE